MRSAPDGIGDVLESADTESSGESARRTGNPTAGVRVIATRFGIYALALPAVALIWFIHRYAVNMVFADQWHDIHIIALSHSGALTLGDLWAQHGENRVLVPDLLVLALAHTTHFNVVYEDYVSGFLLIATAVLLIVAHRRRSPSTPWIYYFPVAIVLLSLNQGTMTLWGFAVSWYLEIFALAVALFLLDRVSLGWLGLVGAVAVTVAGAFSSLEGLLIWPVGLLLLYHRRRSRAAILVWITAAVVTTGLYMFHFDFTTAGTGTKSFVLTHPLTGGKVLLLRHRRCLRRAVAQNAQRRRLLLLSPRSPHLCVAAWVLIVGLPRHDRSTGSPIGVAMVLFGVLYTVALTEGRGSLGLSVLPRYAIFELLILAGCYLAVLDGSLFEEREGRIARIGRRISVAGVIRRLEGPGGRARADRRTVVVQDGPHRHPRRSHRRPLPSSTDRTLRGLQCCRRLARVKSWPPPTSPSTSATLRIRSSGRGSARRGNQFRLFGAWPRRQGPNI